MYFIGMLEKILNKPELKEIKTKNYKTEISKTETNKKPESDFKYNSFTKEKKPDFVKKEFKPYEKKSTSGYVKKEFVSYEKKEKTENCYGLFAVDGHSFNAMYNNQKVILKLDGVWTPENNQPFHKDAKNFLDSKIKKKVLYLNVKKQDEEGNHVVEVFEDKSKAISVNKQLIDLGYSIDNKETFQKVNQDTYTETDDSFTDDNSYFNEKDIIESTIKPVLPQLIETKSLIIPSERIKALKFPK